MFVDFDYDIFPLIISSGDDFKCEINQIKSKIIPKVVSIYGNCKHFSLAASEVVKVTERGLSHLSLINLDAVGGRGRGSVSVCLLGEHLGDEAALLRRVRVTDDEDNKKLDSASFVEKFTESVKVAASSGYSWISDEVQSKEPSLIELLSMQAGLINKIKFPLFYFRVSGGPISEGDQTLDFRKDDVLNLNRRMERLKEKLIRNGLPIRFYGSTEEFDQIVEKDLLNIISQYPDKTKDQDDFAADQRCFEKEKCKYFSRNKRIEAIISELDCFYSSLSLWTKSHHDFSVSEKIDFALKDFYRKDFSDKLQNSIQKVRKKIISETPKSCENMKLFILGGPRGSGKSSIVANWLSCHTDPPIIVMVHYCEASSDASDLRYFLRRLITSIRTKCGYKTDLGYEEVYSIECEISHLNQELIGAMQLSQKVGLRLLIIIDGLDHLGDKYVKSSQEIKNTHWIPEHIPDNIRFILTCTMNDFSLIKLRSIRNDFYILETFQDDNVTADMINCGIEGLNRHISYYGQTCPDFILRNIKDWALISNPMVQKILAQCFHTMGHIHNWTVFIESISECHSIVELVRRIMKLWISILNWEIVAVNDKSLKKKYSKHKEENEEDGTHIKGWIPDCLSLLVLSRNGVSVKSLPHLLEKLGYTKEYLVTEFDLWSLFHFAQEIMLRCHKGNFEFSNSLCKEIVAHTFLAIAACSSVETCTQECQDSMYVDKRCKLHLLLANHFWDKRNNDERNLEECIYHLNRASDCKSVANLLFHPRILLELFNVDLWNFDTWFGDLGSVHKFLDYYSILSSQGFEIITKFKDILKEQYGISSNSCNDESVENTEPLPCMDFQTPKNSFQSDFAKKLEIKFEEIEIKDIFKSFTTNQSLKFLFLLGKIAVLLKRNDLAAEIFRYFINTSEDQVMVSKALFSMIKCEGPQYRNPESSIKSQMYNLLELTSKILEDETDVVRKDHISYLRGLVLLQQHSFESTLLANSEILFLLNEVRFYADDLNSIVLNSQLLEFECDNIEINNDHHCIERKMFLLSKAITTLEMWTGYTDIRLARLWIKLGECLKHGNYQSRLKAEACCRRAISIWKELCSENEKTYNSEECECCELLISLLLQDICQTTISEAKYHLYSIYDCRVKAVGCYHPDTKRLVPLMKLVNSAETRNQSLNRPKSETFNNRFIQNSNLSSKNMSNINTSDTNVRKTFLHDSRPVTSYSLQFINKYSATTDTFNEDIDWDAFAEGKNFNSGSRNVSSFSKRSLSRSTRTDLLSCKLSGPSFHYSSTSLNSDLPRYIYSGHNSSINLSDSVKIHKRNIQSKESKVRFSAGYNNPYVRQDLIDRMQSKLNQIQISKSRNWIPRKKSFSATFSAPYYCFADLIL